MTEKNHTSRSLMVFFLAVLATMSLAFAATLAPLVIAEKNRVVARKDTHLIVVLDLKPNGATLKTAAAGASDLILGAAAAYAKEYLAKAEFNTIPKAVVYLISVDSMDEYNRANFNGMKRYGTLTFERKGSGVVLVENKLAFTL